MITAFVLALVGPVPAQAAVKDLRLDHLTVVHAGEGAFPLGSQIRAVAVVVWRFDDRGIEK